jgi:protein phosphatase
MEPRSILPDTDASILRKPERPITRSVLDAPLQVRHRFDHDIVTNSASTLDDRRPDDAARIVVRLCAVTDVGTTREHNEDSFLVGDLDEGHVIEFGDPATRTLALPARGLVLMVADGMGGAASGELASSMAVESMMQTLRDRWVDGGDGSAIAFATALRTAATEANTRLHQYARRHPEHRGMGTTATVAGLLGDRIYAAQVGDSRAYLVRGGRASQITKDQSLIQRLVEAGELTQEEAETSARRNIILQALGPEASITVDLTHQQIREGDALVLCSDGLSGLVRSDEIGAMAAAIDDPSELCRTLISLANQRGGPDNITVIVARFEGAGLEASLTDDQVGYANFELESPTGEPPARATPTGSRFKSDPTPPLGLPAFPSPAEPAMAVRAAPAAPVADLGASSDLGSAPPRAGDSEAELDERRRRARPIVALLWIVAIAIGALTIWRLLLVE